MSILLRELRSTLTVMIDSAFKNILEILTKQNRRPFLKRYLKREEAREELVWCDSLLSDALQLFDVSCHFHFTPMFVF